MKLVQSVVVTGASLLALGSIPGAQVSEPKKETVSSAALDEIIVTARRKEESIQDVPSAITAVTADNLEKLNILRFDDLDKVVAGLQLQGSISIPAARGAKAPTRWASPMRPTIQH